MKACVSGGIAVAGGWCARFFVICLIAGLAGCATQSASVPAAAKSREALVKERSQSRWNALLKSEWGEAYRFYSPGSRAVLSYEDFIRSVRVDFWKGAEVETVECRAEESCEAIVMIEYGHRGARIRTPVRETWVRTEGTWWYVQK